MPKPDRKAIYQEPRLVVDQARRAIYEYSKDSPTRSAPRWLVLGQVEWYALRRTATLFELPMPLDPFQVATFMGVRIATVNVDSLLEVV